VMSVADLEGGKNAANFDPAVGRRALRRPPLFSSGDREMMDFECAPDRVRRSRRQRPPFDRPGTVPRRRVIR
jgi:hypothetical protein